MSRRAVRPSFDLLRVLADLATGREPLVLVTVVAASGSAPGKPGAKMIVTRDRIHGTVGGGKVEQAALTRARELLGSGGGPESVDYHVIQDLGMTCGGSMTVLYEPVTPPPRLVIFGAGHVSEALCAVASLAGFDVTVCDDRPEWLTRERFPAAADLVSAPFSEAAGRVPLDAQTFVASVTPGHANDLEVVRALLSREVRPRYLGVIGSRRKGVLLKKDLAGTGLPAADVEAIRIPMGLDIGAVDPREIAVSVVAELVAVLRGTVNPLPWNS